MEERNVILTVNISDILTSALAKWRMILLIGLLCGVGMLIYEVRLDLLARSDASKIVFAPEPTNTDITDELERAFLDDNAEAVRKSVTGYKKLVSANNDYQNKSIFMQIDPYAAPRTRGSFVIRVPGGATEFELRQLADAYIRETERYEYIEDLAEAMGTEPRYLKEIYKLSVTDNALVEAADTEEDEGTASVPSWAAVMTTEKYDSITLELLVRGRTDAEAERIFTEVSGIITETAPAVVKSDLPHTIEASGSVNEVIRDKWLVEQQTNVLKAVSSYDNTITTTRTNSEKLRKPSRRRYSKFQARTGGIDLKKVVSAVPAGMLAALILFIVAALLTPFVIGYDEPDSRFGLKKLGAYSGELKERPFAAVDRFIYKHFGGDSFDTREHCDRFTAMNIRGAFPEGTRLVLVPEGVSADETRDLSERLSAAAEWAGAGNEFESSDSVEMLTVDNPDGPAADIGRVILVMKRNSTKKKDLRQSLAQLHRFGREVAGYLML